MLDIIPSSQFRKDVKKLRRSGNHDMKEMETVVSELAGGKEVPEKFRSHPLKGELQGYEECHIRPDWLLVYQIDRKSRALLLVRTGSHSELFE